VGIIDASSIDLPLMPGPFNGVIDPPQMFKSLVDTGCQRTMISTNVVARLGLSAIGKAGIQGVGPNVTYHNTYLFYVAFVLPIIIPGQVVVPGTFVKSIVHILPSPIYGGEITSTSGFDVLLGMDVISFGSLKVEGNGSFSFSF
jgi:hypothetical protein